MINQRDFLSFHKPLPQLRLKNKDFTVSISKANKSG